MSNFYLHNKLWPGTLWQWFLYRFYIYFNRFKFRYLGVKLGNRSIITNSVFLKLQRGATCQIGDDFVAFSGNNLTPICSNVKMSIDVYANASLVIGNGCGISSGTIWATASITIGNYVNIGGNCIIIDGDMHNIDWQARRMDRQQQTSFKRKAIVIEDDVWIGANVVILKGVHIGEKAVIGAGSVVTQDIPAGCVAAGNPCHVIRRIEDHDA